MARILPLCCLLNMESKVVKGGEKSKKQIEKAGSTQHIANVHSTHCKCNVKFKVCRIESQLNYLHFNII